MLLTCLPANVATHLLVFAIDIVKDPVERSADSGLDADLFHFRPRRSFPHFDELDNFVNRTVREKFERIEETRIGKDVDVADIILIDDAQRHVGQTTYHGT